MEAVLASKGPDLEATFGAEPEHAPLLLRNPRAPPARRARGGGGARCVERGRENEEGREGREGRARSRGKEEDTRESRRKSGNKWG
eukprot:1054467-Rhodomonas_salina.1